MVQCKELARCKTALARQVLANEFERHTKQSQVRKKKPVVNAKFIDRRMAEFKYEQFKKAANDFIYPWLREL